MDAREGPSGLSPDVSETFRNDIRRGRAPGLRKKLEYVLDPGGYEVDHVLAHRKGRQGTEYLIQWKNCSYLQSTWKPEHGLASAQQALQAYLRKTRQIDITLDGDE